MWMSSVSPFVNAVTTVGALGAVLVAGMLINSPRGQAQSSNSTFDPSKVEQGLDIAPVPLTYSQAQRNLVGYGSWLVNAVADCNGCHTAGGPPNFNLSLIHI